MRTFVCAMAVLAAIHYNWEIPDQYPEVRKLVGFWIIVGLALSVIQDLQDIFG